MPEIPFATVDEIEDGGRKLVKVRGREIVVFRRGTAYHALVNRCPHQGASLCAGRLSGFMTSDAPGEFRLERVGEVIVCPWHGWHFDITTGQSWCDPGSIKARRYAVTVAPGESLAKGPYVAETFAVKVRPGTGLMEQQVEGGPVAVEPGRDYLVLQM